MRRSVRYAFILALAVSFSGCVMVVRDHPPSDKTGGESRREVAVKSLMSPQERNALVGALGGAACGAAVGVGVATANPIILGAAAGLCAGAALGASQPVPEPYSGAYVIYPPAPPERRPLLAFVRGEDPALRSALAYELSQRGWAVSQDEGRPPGSTFFSARRRGAALEVEVYTARDNYAAASGSSLDQALDRALAKVWR